MDTRHVGENVLRNADALSLLPNGKAESSKKFFVVFHLDIPAK